MVAIIFAVSTITYASIASSLTKSIILHSAGTVKTSSSSSTIVVKVSQGIDDGFRWVRYYESGQTGYEVDRSGVCYDTGKDYWGTSQVVADSWWLFREVNVPCGATVLNATLTFTASATQRGDVCNTKILAEAVDNAIPITGNYKEGWDDYENRPKTVAAVPWHNLPPWREGERHTSPDISPVIQEIVNRPGWTSGNAIQIFWMDDSSEGVEALRSACGYEYPLAPGSGEYAVELEVTYEIVTG